MCLNLNRADCKSSNILDCHFTPTCSGEITIKNGNVDVSDKIALDIITGGNETSRRCGE